MSTACRLRLPAFTFIEPLVIIAIIAIIAIVAFLAAAPARGATSVSAWVPIYQGVDQASGTNDSSYVGTLSAHAVRVDLQNPTIGIFVTPPVTNNYVPDQRETLLQTPREFALEHGVQVAINAGTFSPGSYNNPSGTPAWLLGATISKGRLVSAQTATNGLGSSSLSAFLFTTNNQATFVPINWPATNTAGIYNAVSGLYPLVTNGVNIAYRYTNVLSDSIHQPQPRTAFGLTQDKRYLILMTVDGRQQFSDGALDYETADLLLLFGAWNGLNMDGGGSTCMVKANACGVPSDINHNSFQEAVQRPGSQRPIGCNLGISALPLPSPMTDVSVIPGTTTAIVTWRTEAESTTQVQYGPTVGYGNVTPFDARPVKFHVATLSGLTPGSTYFYRAVSQALDEEYSLDCTLSTTSGVSRELVFPMTHTWKYSTNNLDGVDWKSLDYDETDWVGPSNALFHIEPSTTPPFAPRNTLLPPGFVVPIFRTYYFRTPFQFSGSTAGASLTFSNYIDDGAVFYLNGAELTRIRMAPPPTVISFSTFAQGTPCGGTLYAGDAATICPDVFTVGGPQLNSLVQGENVVAVEVHNISGGTTTQDILFGGALFINRPTSVAPLLLINQEAGASTLFWNGEGFTLQQSTDLSSTNNWFDVPGPVTQSPFTTNGTNGNANTAFFRLRN